MQSCWLVFALTIYLSLDVTNPLMPGALTFGIEDTVEVRQADRFRGRHDVVVPAQPFERIRSIDAEVVRNPLRPMEPIRAASSRLQRTRSSLFVPSAPSEVPLIH